MSQQSWRSFFPFVLRYSWYVHYQGMIKNGIFLISLYVRPYAYLLVCDNVALYNCNGRIIWDTIILLQWAILDLNFIPDICTIQNQSSTTCIGDSVLCSTLGIVYFWFCNQEVKETYMDMSSYFQWHTWDRRCFK